MGTDDERPTADRGGPRTLHPSRPELRALAVITGLTSLAVAQPLFSLLALDATIFQARASNRWVLILFAVAVVAVPPLVLWGLEYAVGRVRPSLRPPVHATIILLLGTMLVLQALKSSGLAPAVLLLASLLVGGGLAYAEHRYEVLRRWLVYLSAAAPVLLVLFLGFPPVRGFITAGTHRAEPAASVEEQAPPVTVVVLDELGTSAIVDADGQIDDELFPNLGALADDGTWYPNHTTVGPHTPLALAAILSGQYPSPEIADAVIASNYDGSLLSLLGGSHDLNVYEPITRFCMPEAGCRPHPDPSAGEQFGYLTDYALDLFRQNVDPRLDAVSVAINEASRDEGDPVAYFDDFLDGMQPDGDTPPLDFLHLTLPHSPYRYAPGGVTYNGPAQPDGALSWQGPWVDDDSAWATAQRHLVQSQYADELVGQVLEQLRRLDRYDETLVVVTADHGSAFRTDEVSRGLTEENVTDIAWTPLVVKLPGQDEPVVDETPVTNLDILPLIATELGVEIPWETDGVPVGERPADDPVKLVGWEVNEVEADEEGFVVTDRRRGYAEVLDSGGTGLDGADAAWRPYQRGPYAALVGTPVESLDVGEGAPASASLDSPGRGVRFDADATTLPLYLRGSLSTDEPSEVAVVVDGVVATVLSTHPELDGRFFGLLPRQAFRDGANDIELYVVEGDAGSPVLQPLADA